MPIINPENNLPDVMSTEKAQFPEWHVKKWCIAAIQRISSNLIGYILMIDVIIV